MSTWVLSIHRLTGTFKIEFRITIIDDLCSFVDGLQRPRPTQLEKDSMHASGFDVSAFLSTRGSGRRILHIMPKQPFFSQGERADSIFYINKGSAKLTVVSQKGKEATIILLGAGDFVGEESLTGLAGRRLSTATAITACTALQIEKAELVRVLHEECAFAEFFLAFMLARSMRTQADLVDQLFNSSEKRLARILLLMADFGKTGNPETLIPKISQETLAEMVGTTRSRVSFFMNRFRHHGFIAYDRRIKVHRSLLTLVLHDQSFEGDAKNPPILPAAQRAVRALQRGNASPPLNGSQE